MPDYKISDVYGMQGVRNVICKHNAIVIKEDKEGNLDYRILDNKCVRCAECVNHYTAGCYMRKVLAIKRN